MPLYEYIAVDKSCAWCKNGFEHLAKCTDPALTVCPKCGQAVRKVFSVPAVGRSASGLDDRAKSAGFHKLKKLGSGEYEKQY